MPSNNHENQRLRVEKTHRRKWLSHATEWQGCTRCPLGKTAHKTVLVRGSIPATVLFIGEAPGVVEDTLGFPFVGRSGKLLDQMILDSRRLASRKGVLSYAIANILGCIPHSLAQDQNSVRPPAPEEVTVCLPRLVEEIKIISPRKVVLLGESAKKYLPLIERELIQDLKSPYFKVAFLNHPAFVLRKGGINSLEYKRNCIKLAEFLYNVTL